MGNGLIVHTTVLRPDGLEMTFMRMCGVERLRSFDPKTGEIVWNYAHDGESYQPVDNITTNDNNEKVYQNLLNN